MLCIQRAERMIGNCPGAAPSKTHRQSQGMCTCWQMSDIFFESYVFVFCFFAFSLPTQQDLRPELHGFKANELKVGFPMRQRCSRRVVERGGAQGHIIRLTWLIWTFLIIIIIIVIIIIWPIRNVKLIWNIMKIYTIFTQQNGGKRYLACEI